VLYEHKVKRAALGDQLLDAKDVLNLSLKVLHQEAAGNVNRRNNLVENFQIQLLAMM
jgi:hypothetical protein